MMKRLTLGLLLTLFARPAFAQRTLEDIEAMSKWLEFEIVHYKIVGEFSGKTTVLTSNNKYAQASVDGEVTDRIEIEFDWNQKTHVLVGTPVIRNSPTKLVRPDMTTVPGCPGVTKVDVAPEFFSGVSVKPDVAAVMGYLVLEGKRDQGTGSFPFKNDAGCSVLTAQASAKVIQIQIQAMSPTALFVPPTPQLRTSADKKSIIQLNPSPTSEFYGWTWTTTPTGVK